MEGTVKIEINNDIGTITFHHPQSNSLPGDVLRLLAATITEAGDNDEIKVIILTL